MKEGFPLHPSEESSLRRSAARRGRRAGAFFRSFAPLPAPPSAGTFLSPERKVPSQKNASLLLVRVLFVFLVAQVDQAFRVRFG